MRGKAFCDNMKKHPPDGTTVDAKCPVCARGLPIIGVTVDLIIEHRGRLWLVQRNDGRWALPGGFLGYDETLEKAAERETKEELGAGEVVLLGQLHTYGDPARDHPRRNVSVVYIAQVDRIRPSKKELQKEGLKKVQGFPLERIPDLAFDHNEIVADYLALKARLLPLCSRRGKENV